MRLKVRSRLEVRLEFAEAILLTVFLKHDQSQNLTEIRSCRRSKASGKHLPPGGITVVSWDVMMGIGQVGTLEVPASKLRDVNVALEEDGLESLSHGILSHLRLVSAD